MKNLKILIAFIIIFSTQSISYAQNKITINGYVKDASNGEDIIGATISIKEKNIAIATNPYGFYSISVEPGKYSISYSYLGYESQVKNIEISKNERIDIQLESKGKELKEVVVSSTKKNENVETMEMSMNKLDIKEIKSIPALLGEVDVIRSIQTLPGVSTVGEGASGFNVRGGGVDQNLILLDEAPVYNSSHLLGFFSVFNPDAVKDVKLLKGGIPAQYGGRLSSLLDIRMKDGNSKDFTANGGIGLISSRLTLEGPVRKIRVHL